MRSPYLGILPCSEHNHSQHSFKGRKTWLFLNSQDIGSHREFPLLNYLTPSYRILVDNKIQFCAMGIESSSHAILHPL